MRNYPKILEAQELMNAYRNELDNLQDAIIASRETDPVWLATMRGRFAGIQTACQIYLACLPKEDVPEEELLKLASVVKLSPKGRIREIDEIPT